MKKVLLKIVALVAAATLALAFAPFFHTSAKADEDNGFSYEDDASGGYDITGYDGPDTDITIPVTINGVRVTGIEAEFDSNANITSITFPTLTADELNAGGPIIVFKDAFADMPMLQSVDFANSAQLDFTDINEAFGNPWFDSDPSLSSFACADGSQYMTVNKDDGVLFSPDQKTLYAYPPAKSDTSYSIPSTVTTLAAGCFVGCASLQDITLPDSLAPGVNASYFSGCTELAQITANPTSANYCSQYGVLLNWECTQLLVYPPAKAGDYAIPASITSLAYGSFDMAAGMTSVSIPAGLSDLGKDPTSGDLVNPFAFSPQLKTIIVDPSNTSYKMVDGVLISFDDKTLIAYPPGRAGTDPSIYAVKKPALQQKNDSAAQSVEKLAGVPAGALTEKEFKAFSKTAKNEKPKTQAKNVVSVVKNGAGMTGNYKVPDSVTFIAQGAFYNTSLAVVSFSNDTKIYSDTDNKIEIADYAFPSDGSVSIAAYATFAHHDDLKAYAFANGVPFIDMNVSAADSILLFEPNKDNDGAIVTGLQDFSYDGDVTIPQKVTIDGTDYDVTEIGDGAFQGADITHVAIPDGVTKLDNEAFSGCQGLFGTLKLPDSITSIGDGCFYDCDELTYVILPGSLKTLGDSAFQSCFMLVDPTLPDHLETIGSACFANCNFENISIPGSVTAIGEECFSYCDHLKSVTLPGTLTRLESGTFWSCGSLESITIPDSVTAIGSDCFNGCSSLTSLSIPKNVGEIGDAAFALCDRLKAFTVDPGNADYQDLDGVLFNKTGADGTATVLICYPSAKAGDAYDIPSGTTTVDEQAFSGPCPVETIHIPWSVSSALNAFKSEKLQAINVDSDVGSANLNFSNYNGDGVLYNYFKTAILAYPLGKTDGTYTIPPTVKSLDKMALANCLFQTVNIPAGLTSIGAGAFSGCPNLANINVASGNKAYASSSGVLFGNTKKTSLLAFPSGRTGSYSVPGGVTSIMDYALYGGSLSSIYFPASLTAMGYMACAENASLTLAAFYGNRYKASGDVDLTFEDADDAFTVFYHVTKAANWSHYTESTGYDSEPFIMLTLNYQDSQKTETDLTPVYSMGLIYEPDDPQPRDGCTFAGWYTEPACVHAWDFDSSKVKGDTTLYTRWMIDTPPSVDWDAPNYNTIRIHWDPIPNAAGYVIQRATGSPMGKYKTIATVKASATPSYTNKSVTTGTTYYYIVQAFTQTGKYKFYGHFSDPVSATATLQTPKAPTVSLVSYKSVKISWAKIPGATKYVVLRSADTDPLHFYVIKTTASRSYTDNNALLGTYHYEVEAVRSGSYSDPSADSEATTYLSAPVIKVVKAGTGIYTASWKAVPGATGYTVYEDGSPIGSTTKTSFTFGLTAGYSYDITVVATRGAASSDPSKIVPVTP
jgi:hypothetical protein